MALPLLRAYRVTAHGHPLECFETTLPSPQGREVLLKVNACGVCHTDLHLWDGYYDLGNGEKIQMSSRGIHPPMTLGHEIVGEVVAAGSEANARIGDRRIIFPWIGCGSCVTCEAGDGHLCLQARTLGIFKPGGYADHVLVPDSDYLFDFSGLSEDLAATLACSGVTVFSALRKLGSPSRVGRPVFIGAGGLGCAGIQLARALGFEPPVVVDISEAKLEAARRLGDISTVNASMPDAAQNIRDLTEGGALAAIDFVGSDRSAHLGIDILRRGGKLIVVGLFGGSLSVPVPTLTLRAISLIGSYVGSIREFEELISLMKSGRVKPTPITSRRLSDATQALLDLRAGRVIGRIVLRP